jgi:hypothetical protein
MALSWNARCYVQGLGDGLLQRHHPPRGPRYEGFLAELGAAPVFVIGGVLTAIVALLGLAHPAIRTLD